VSRFHRLRLPHLPVVAQAEVDKLAAAAVVAEVEVVPRRRRLLLPLPFNSWICA
jgi:hypothetical protein